MDNLFAAEFKTAQNLAVLLVHLECPFTCLQLVHSSNQLNLLDSYQAI